MSKAEQAYSLRWFGGRPRTSAARFAGISQAVGLVVIVTWWRPGHLSTTSGGTTIEKPGFRGYMDGVSMRIGGGLCLFLLCGQGLCQTPGGSAQTNTQSLLAGTFESVARGDSFFGGGTSNAAPLFTLTLETNGTYYVFCASADIEPHMDGGKGFIRAGQEFGTWKWDRQRSEVVCTATNRSHMTRVFPAHLRVERGELNRLAVDTQPAKDPKIPQSWIPLSSPYLYRKAQ